MVSSDDAPTQEPPQGSGRLAAPCVFSVNQTVAGRYRIARFIARGGMGEVYEAEDLELGGRVALKTILPQFTTRDSAVDRFKREIYLARKVTHPNVCRIFEFGVEQRAMAGSEQQVGPKEKILFLTMEMLAGETLSQRLKDRGRFTEAEALPLFRQMAEGLGAAHDVSVVHRDFKSQNVILVPARGDLRAVITDFGLAHSSEVAEQLPTALTVAGVILGSPETMAPEQLTGGPITAATDIYALGVVLYQMLTGTTPFPSETPRLLYRRLVEAAPSPRIHNPDLSERWAAVILRCLEREPVERFANVKEVVEAVYQEDAVTAISPSRRRRSVGVLGFKNLSGLPDAAWLSTAFSEMLGTELAVGERLRVIPGENVARMKVELSLTEVDSFGADTLQRIWKNLGADLVVFGSYLALGEKAGGQIRLDLRLQDTLAGETVASVWESGTEAAFFDLISRAGEQLRGRLGLGARSAAEAQQVRMSLPNNPEAARLYAEGLERLRVFDYRSALKSLEKAAAIEPAHPFIHSALASVWSDLGSEEKAQLAGRRALELSAGLSREERLLIEGTYRAATGEMERATEIYRTLFNFFPDNLEYGLRLAELQHLNSRRAHQALVTVEELRKLPPPLCDDPRIDLQELHGAYAAKDYPRAQAMAARAVAKATAQGAWVMVAVARRMEGWIFRDLGDSKNAVSAFHEAKRLVVAARHRILEAVVLRDLGHMLWWTGDLSGASRMFVECIAISREVGSKRHVAAALGRLARVLFDQGVLSEASRVLDEWLALERERDGKWGIGQAQMLRAQILRKQGALAEAKSLYEEQVTEGRGIWTNADHAAASLALGQLFMARGDLVESRKRLQEALALNDESGNKAGSAISRRELAKLSVEEGHTVEAEALALQSATELESQGARPAEALAYAVHAESLLEQGKLPEARLAIERATVISGNVESLGVRLAVAVAAARVRASSNDAKDMNEACNDLETALSTAVSAGFVGEQFEVRLALGEIEIASGKAADGRARLEILEQEATAKGFSLVARKAASCRK